MTGCCSMPPAVVWGVLRRNPEGRWNKTAVNIRELAELQRELLFSRCSNWSSREAACSIRSAVSPCWKPIWSSRTFLPLTRSLFWRTCASQLLRNGQSCSPGQGTLRTYPHQPCRNGCFFCCTFQATDVIRFIHHFFRDGIMIKIATVDPVGRLCPPGR